jgi:hypothetical protein
MKFAKWSVLPLAALCATALLAERVLLPVSVSPWGVPGAHGSEWKGELWIYNQNQAEALVRTHWSACMITCPPGSFTIPPGRAVTVPHDGPGILQIYPGGGAPFSGLALNARIYDASRQSEDWGTEIPIVTESEFLTRNWLVNIPNEAGFRKTLRIYEWDATEATDVNVRLVDQQTGAVLADRRHQLRPMFTHTNFFRFGYLEGDFNQLLPESAQSSRVAIEISSPGGGRLWAMVSVTHNETQRVTLVTPQLVGKGW